jgi:hypothetical protein
MLAAIPFDKKEDISFGIDAIEIDESENDREIKKRVNKHIIACFNECGMPQSMWEDELGRYDFFLVPHELYANIDASLNRCRPQTHGEASQISTFASMIYEAFNIRAAKVTA